MPSGPQQCSRAEHPHPDCDLPSYLFAQPFRCKIREGTANWGQDRNREIGCRSPSAALGKGKATRTDQINEKPGVIKVDGKALAEVPDNEIGRASCRERV